MEKSVQEVLLYLGKAVESMPLGVTVVDREGSIIYANPAQARMHGYHAKELVGGNAALRLGGAPGQRLTLEQLRALRPWKRERTNTRKDGTTFPAQLVSDVVRDEAGEPMAVVTTCEDITERKEAEALLLRHAFYDALTGLPNRALFMDRLSLALGRARRGVPFAALLLDLDRFKQVNDSMGHAFGDRLLSETAHRLETCVRPGDTVSRLGGDEFAILLEDMQDARTAIRIAERTQAELARPIPLDGRELRSSASIGIALGGSGHARPEEILRDADLAMYRAKALGRARYEVFDPTLVALADSALRTP
jgi:diguanylate cyclase (GGDEF)-like protein/PAS domain S-box-containing protein